jgi:hypothetical protein
MIEKKVKTRYAATTNCARVQSCSAGARRCTSSACRLLACSRPPPGCFVCCCVRCSCRIPPSPPRTEGARITPPRELPRARRRRRRRAAPRTTRGAASRAQTARREPHVRVKWSCHFGSLTYELRVTCECWNFNECGYGVLTCIS